MKKAFTLIELLVAIAVIGLLATIILMSLSSARFKARDSKTISQMSQIPSALSIIYSTEGEYNSICDSEISFSDDSGLKKIQDDIESVGKSIKCFADGDNYCISTELNSG